VRPACAQAAAEGTLDTLKAQMDNMGQQMEQRCAELHRSHAELLQTKEALGIKER